MTDMAITPELSRLANSEFSELDAAISYLNGARASRANVRATVAFKTGDPVVFDWPTNKGYRKLVGEFVAPDTEKAGRVRITKAQPVTPETGLDISCGVYCVDAAKVEHKEDTQ